MRNGFIDFMRFIFAILIVLHHSWVFANTMHHDLVLQEGFIGVEFFYILTGVLVAKKKPFESSNHDAYISTKILLLRKIKVFYLPQLQ